MTTALALILILVVLPLGALLGAMIGGWTGRAIVAVCVALWVTTFLVMVYRASDQANREVDACLVAGGIPDRSGRLGYRVNCYHQSESGR